MPKENKSIHRDAKTGRFVTEDYAKKHPATTVTETRKENDKPKNPKKSK